MRSKILVGNDETLFNTGKEVTYETLVNVHKQAIDSKLSTRHYRERGMQSLANLC